jgi:prolyl 4-hydroxylase
MDYLHLPAAFSPKFCEEILTFSHRAGFLPATVRSYGAEELRTHIRNNERLDWVDEALTARMEEALRVAAGAQFPATFNGTPFSRLGRRLRIYRYHPGQYFKPHKDGHEKVGDLESQLTVLVYLNDTQGGETILMPQGAGRRDSWVPVAPRAGDVLIFWHDIWHEGRPVTAGEKYVLRTDMFYLQSPRPE